MKIGKKWMLIVGIAVLISFLFLGCVKNQVTLNNSITEPECLGDDCYSHQAIELNQVSICDKITHARHRSECIISLAKKQDNISICKSMTNFDDKSVCLSEVAVKSNNISVCSLNEYLYYKGMCLRKYVFVKNDLSLCEEISEDSAKDICLLGPEEGMAKQNETFCGKEIPYSKDHCYEIVAKSQEKLTVCDKIQNDMLSTNCKDSIYYKLASENGDLTICNKIVIDTRKNECMNMSKNI